MENLIPDILPIEEGGMMNDLIILDLSSTTNIQCLIETEKRDSSVFAFCNLAKLYLFEMGIEDLYRGSLPSGFLEQLEIITLVKCWKLENTLFNGNLKLHHLKSMKLEDCPKVTSIFQPSTAQSLTQLEELTIRSCTALEYIIVCEDGDSNQKSYYDSLFPRLKIFQIAECNKLRIVLPILFTGGLASLDKIRIYESEHMEYIFDQFQEGEDAMLPSLKELELSGVPSFFGIFKEHQLMISSMPPLSRHNSNKIHQSPTRHAFSWVQSCCYLNKSRYASEETNVAVSGHRSLDHTNSLELVASTHGIPPFHASQSFLVQSLKNVREIRLVECSNLISLSTVSIAASTTSLKVLIMSKCHKLKCITTHEGDAQVDKNYYSIFPRLENLEIEDCKELEFLFLSKMSCGLEKLKYLIVKKVPELKYVVGKYQQEQNSSNHKQNDELHFNFPALKILSIEDAPKINNICAKNYVLVLSSLQNIVKMWNCGVKSLTDSNMVNWTTTEELVASTYGVHPFHATQSLLVQSLKNVREIKLVECPNLISLSALSTAASTISLKVLAMSKCHKLKCITTHEGCAQVDKNYCSIFPRLENIEIEDCKELEFLFLSAISGVLEELKSLTVKGVPELKYVVGVYQKEQYSSNKNKNDGLHFDLPVLKILCIKDAPKINSVCAKNYKLELSSLQHVELWNCGIKSFTDYSMGNLGNIEELHAPTDRDPPFHGAQSLLVQPLKNVREIKLVESSNLISLSTLSTAVSTISLKNLTISQCDNLKCITTYEGDVQVDKNYNSIFPRLEKLEVEYCNELEFLFLSTMSGGLEKLKSLTIKGVPKLIHVIGNYQMEQHSSKQNQNDKLHFDVPALEILYIQDAPKINSICTTNYKLVLSSLQNVEMWSCGIKSFTDHNMEVHVSANGAPLFHAAQSLLVQSLKYIRKMKLVYCESIVSVSTLATASTILLEDLTIGGCHRLKCIVADEGDAGIDTNCNSIFPKLKLLQLSYCNALEYLFPAYAFRFPLYLESLRIYGAPMLKYVFGRSQHENSLIHENQNVQTHIDFPTLKDLSIKDMPELVSIFPENYYLRGSSLRSIVLEEPPEFTMRHFNEFFVCQHTKQQKTKAIEMCQQTLESLVVEVSKIEVIFYLPHMGKEKNGDGLQPLTSSIQELELRDLSELVNLCLGPTHVICFRNLRELFITACKKLKVIFSVSVVRSLPQLNILDISKCEELVHIVEEDYETNVDGDHLHHEPCFPNLEQVSINQCDKLEHLFSVTVSDILPKLSYLGIREAYGLEHILIRRGDELKERKDVLPQLRYLTLEELPNLVSICHGINFQILKEDDCTNVLDCPNFSFYEASTTQLQIDSKTTDSEVEEKAEKFFSHLSADQYINMGDASTQQSISLMKEETEEIVEEHFISETAKTTITSSNLKLMEQLVIEARAKEGVSSKTLHHSPLTSEKVSIHTSSNLIVLPTRDNILACAKIFGEEEEEEEEEGNLITSRCSRNGIKAGNRSFIEEKLETSIDDEVQVCDKFHPHSTTLFEGVDNRDINESVMVQNESKSNVEPSNLMQRGQQPSYSKSYSFTYSQPRRAIESTNSATISQDESSEIVGVEEGALLETPHPISPLASTQEPILVSPNPPVLLKTSSTTAKIFEEEEKGGLITTHRHQSDMKALSYLPKGKEHKTSNLGDLFMPPIPNISSEQASETILLSLVPSRALIHPKRTPVSTPLGSTNRINVEENVGTTNHPLHEALGAIQISSQLVECSSSEIAPSIYDTHNALNVLGVKEIVDMMKLEGAELSMLSEAFITNPRLLLSSEYRSTELLCFSYRVLLNILKILATRTPLTITEADKGLLAKYLNDASVLGFDKDWLESIRIKVFNYDISEVQHMQQVLKDLGHQLQTKKIELAIVHDQEVKAAQSTEMAQKVLEAARSHFNITQQEHATARVRYSQLLEECQEILEQRDQCWETITSQFKPFGF